MEKDIVLFRYQIVLQPDGHVRSEVRGIAAEDFTKAANEANEEWENTPIIARGLEYLNKNIKLFDEDFEKFLRAL